MTQEQKAKAYDEALERARKLKYNPKSIFFEHKNEPLPEYIFPELKESEDERIRKALIDLFSSAGKKDWRDIPTEKILAWLEKQGEQNLNKVEPKFKVGDWVAYNHNPNLPPKKIIQITNKHYVFADCSFGTKTLEIDWHPWTIQDAKDGDVLVNGSNIFIFHFIYDTRLMGYCHVNTDDGRFYDDIGKNECFCLIDAVVNPATKEQRDLLFQKMKEAGYEWNDEKKELKKIEDEEYNGEDYGIDGLWHAQRILEKTLGKVSGYQTDDGFLSHQCAITAVKKLYKQKPAEWSEEDEKTLNEIFSVAARASLRKSTLFGKSYDYIKWQNWLKSLRDRVAPQQKNGWGEDDEDYIEMLIDYLKELSKLERQNKLDCNYYPHEKIINWLKSLRPQNHWKPSEEQMRAFEMVYDWYNKNFMKSETFDSLYNDLKKL